MLSWIRSSHLSIIALKSLHEDQYRYGYCRRMKPYSGSMSESSSCQPSGTFVRSFSGAGLRWVHLGDLGGFLGGGLALNLQVLTLCRSLIVESWNRSFWPKGKRHCLRHLAQEGGLKPTVQINVESKDPRENFRLFKSPGVKINRQRDQTEKGGSNVPGYSVWAFESDKGNSPIPSWRFQG